MFILSAYLDLVAGIEITDNLLEVAHQNLIASC